MFCFIGNVKCLSLLRNYDALRLIRRTGRIDLDLDVPIDAESNLQALLRLTHPQNPPTLVHERQLSNPTLERPSRRTGTVARPLFLRKGRQKHRDISLAQRRADLSKRTAEARPRFKLLFREREAFCWDTGN